MSGISKIKLSELNLPEDLKDMDLRHLDLLSYEIRDFLIDNVSKTGGHLSPNLGVVELTIALHKVFDSPKDKIIWDVGHQSYVHKILTGRASEFHGLRKYDGLSGFPKREESPHDCFDTGHSSNSISAGLGMAIARDLQKKKFEVIAVIGDGALTGGLAFEALNNVGVGKSKMLIVVNDNGMSISKNIGGLSTHLSKLRMSGAYLGLKSGIKKTLRSIPMVGSTLYNQAENIRDGIKSAVNTNGAYFETLGIKYLGPFDGHNIAELIQAFEMTKKIDSPVVLHVITQKGRGYINSEDQPDKFHGVSPFNPETGMCESKSEKSYSAVFGDSLEKFAENDENIVAVSAAMLSGTGLSNFAAKFPKRTFDVGIAEGHALSFAAGLAVLGMKPVVAIYSTFLQRAYDQIVIDICMQNLPVILAIDRAGIVGEDGETHNGVFDIAYLLPIPNLRIFAPADETELFMMLKKAFELNSPVAIRYPRGKAENFWGIYEDYGDITKPKIHKQSNEVNIIAIGRMVKIAIDAVEILSNIGIDAGLVNLRQISPLPKEELINIACDSKCIVTIEDGVIRGGAGQAIVNMLKENKICANSLVLGFDNEFIKQGKEDLIFDKYGLDAKGIAERVREFIER
ncbi:MAG: 1-deoxy-D-xylulose-5-phosphate synthase [Eubacteriales bacterium]